MWAGEKNKQKTILKLIIFLGKNMNTNKAQLSPNDFEQLVENVKMLNEKDLSDLSSLHVKQYDWIWLRRSLILTWVSHIQDIFLFWALAQLV